MNDNRRIVETTDSVGQPLCLVVIKPNHKISQEASMAYSVKVSTLIRGGIGGCERLLLRSEVDAYLLKSGIWTVDDAKKLQELSMTIRASELAIERGGIHIQEARKMAIAMSKSRSEIIKLVSKKQQLDSVTIESVAENYKFAILATKCIKYQNDNRPYFIDYDDFMQRGGDEGVSEACTILAEILYGTTSDLYDNLFETRWLKKAGFTNGDGKFIDKQNRLIDENDRLIDKHGRFVNEDGDLVDFHGIRITENGDFCCTNPKPFVNDDGKEIMVNLHSTVTKKKKSKTRKKRSSKIKKKC